MMCLKKLDLEDDFISKIYYFFGLILNFLLVFSIWNVLITATYNKLIYILIIINLNHTG